VPQSSQDLIGDRSFGFFKRLECSQHVIPAQAGI
jgi:hypothetical protein